MVEIHIAAKVFRAATCKKRTQTLLSAGLAQSDVLIAESLMQSADYSEHS